MKTKPTLRTLPHDERSNMSDNNKDPLNSLAIFLMLCGPALTPIVCAPILGLFWIIDKGTPGEQLWVIVGYCAVAGLFAHFWNKKPPKSPNDNSQDRH